MEPIYSKQFLKAGYAGVVLTGEKKNEKLDIYIEKLCTL
jgi:hypothetical protein